MRKSLLIARVVSVNRKPGLQQRVRTGGGIRGVRRDWKTYVPWLLGKQEMMDREVV